jgi:hypothetical protein
MSVQRSSNLGLKSFNTYKKKHIKTVNCTMFANKIVEHRELNEVERIRQSCGHQEPSPRQHTVQQTCGTHKTV